MEALMRLTPITTLVCFLFSAQVFAGSTVIGATDCDAVVKYTKGQVPSDDTREGPWKRDVAWTMGYLSALSVSETPPNTVSDRLHTLTPKQLNEAIASYCTRFPLKDLEDASIDIYNQMGGKKVRTAQ
jgi:hypothetical protein